MSSGRLRAIYLLLAAVSLILVVQAANLQLIEGFKYRSEAETLRLRRVAIPAPRGVILDRNGGILAGNRQTFRVGVVKADLPKDKVQRQMVFFRLAELLNIPYRLVALKEIARQDGQGTVDRIARSLKMDASALRAELASDKGDNVVLLSEVPAGQARSLWEQFRDIAGVRLLSDIEVRIDDKRYGPYDPVPVAEDVPRDRALTIEENHLQLPGVVVTAGAVRNYAEGLLYSHVVGYVGEITDDELKASGSMAGGGPYSPGDIVGKSGIEAVYEELLRGHKGLSTVEMDATGRAIRTVGRPQLPAQGDTLVLTLDLKLQRAAAAALDEAISKAGVSAGAIVALDPRNGEILAMVSRPTFDINAFAKGIDPLTFSSLANDPGHPLLNRAISGLYPPGSTFKMVMAAAGLQEGVITPQTKVHCGGAIYVPYTFNEAMRQIYRDWLPTGHGEVDVVKALAESCDVFFYNVGTPRAKDDAGNFTRYYDPGGSVPKYFQGLGIERINEYARSFGLGRRTGIDLPAEESGLVAGPEWKETTFPGSVWSIGDTIITSIGQGYLLLTPLQLANITAAVANGGTLYKPHLLKQVNSADGQTVRRVGPSVLGRVPVSAENLALVRQGMLQAVSPKGTAYRLKLPDVKVAGKTGTAEFGEPIDAAGTRRSHAWFAAFAPYDEPSIAVVALIEGGTEQLEGSTYAVPAVEKVLRAYFGLDKP